MATKHKVAVIVGSLRKDSLNLKLAKAMIGLAPESLSFDIVPIGDLPLYNPDLDVDTVPAPWKRFRDSMHSAQAVLFVTPEYNRTIPGGLKNAIDVGSRPYGKSVWSMKPAGVVSASPGAMGGFGANHVLRQSLVFLNMPAMQQPEAYIGGLGELFDAAENIAKPETKAFLTSYMKAFADWVASHAKG